MKTLKGAVYGSHAYNIVMECILCFTTTSSNFLHIAGYCMMSWQTRGGGGGIYRMWFRMYTLCEQLKLIYY